MFLNEIQVVLQACLWINVINPEDSFDDEANLSTDGIAEVKKVVFGDSPGLPELSP
jgi:hypothetical protein